jgi:uncharacterized protein
MAPTIVYITGFRQHAGKTVTSLGLIALFRKYIDPIHIGYIKPVGQELVEVEAGRKIDKDARLVKEFANIPDMDLRQVSPVRVGSGFTRSFLSAADTREETQKLENTILESVKSLAHKKIIIAEGTGHPGVGSIVGLSNANVAALINADIVFLSGGGIGKALDMLEVDLSYFLFKRVRVRGIVFNKLIPDKIETMKQFVTDALLNRLYGAFGGSLSILGFLPMIDLLSQPSMKVVYENFRGAVPIGDSADERWQAPCASIKVISLTEDSLKLDRYITPQSLVIIAANSFRRVKSICDFNEKLKAAGEGVSGIILTCGESTPDDRDIEKEILRSGIPAMYVNEDTATAEKFVLETYENSKLQIYEKPKLREVEQLFERYFDFEKFLDTFQIKL